MEHIKKLISVANNFKERINLDFKKNPNSPRPSNLIEDCERSLDNMDMEFSNLNHSIQMLNAYYKDLSFGTESGETTYKNADLCQELERDIDALHVLLKKIAENIGKIEP